MKTLMLLVAALALALPAPAQTPAPINVPVVEWDMEYPPLPNQNVGIDPTAPAMTSSWTTAAGFDQSVTTPRKTGEGKNNQAKRHHVAVQALVNEMGGPAAQTSGT